MRWDDPALRVAADPPLRAKHRLLQSWYRETILRLEASPPAKGPRKTPVGNWIPPVDMSGSEEPNFLPGAALDAVRERERRRDWGGGMLDSDRLHRNLLSSQPLCFNLFGELAHHPTTLADALRVALELPVAEIRDVRIEWAPPRDIAIGGASFDAFVEYTTTKGGRGFVGIETKYTEDLTPQDVTEAQWELYLSVVSAERSGFAGDCRALIGSQSQQFLINTCVAVNVRNLASFDAAHVAVLHLSEDRAAVNALVQLQNLRTDRFVRSCSLESFVAHLGGVEELRGHFVRRYLDLAPIVGAL